MPAESIGNVTLTPVESVQLPPLSGVPPNSLKIALSEISGSPQTGIVPSSPASGAATIVISTVWVVLWLQLSVIITSTECVPGEISERLFGTTTLSSIVIVVGAVILLKSNWPIGLGKFIDKS